MASSLEVGERDIDGDILSGDVHILANAINDAAASAKPDTIRPKRQNLAFMQPDYTSRHKFTTSK